MPNDERSHAGPKTQDTRRDELPALADAIGWADGVMAAYHGSMGVRTQTASALSIRITQCRRTLPNGSSMMPSFGNGRLVNAAKCANSATTSGKMWAGGGDISCQVSPTLYLMGDRA